MLQWQSAPLLIQVLGLIATKPIHLKYYSSGGPQLCEGPDGVDLFITICPF